MSNTENKPAEIPTKNTMPGSNQILKFFKYDHLPEKFQKISKPFGDLAFAMEENLIPSAETSTMLRKLLEAKDCAVRAALMILIMFTMSACSSTPKAQTFTLEQAKQIYEKGIQDAKPKPMTLLTSPGKLDTAAITMFKYVDFSNGDYGFSEPADCSLTSFGKIDTGSSYYQFYKGIAKSFCPDANFSAIENPPASKTKPIPTPVPSVANK